MCQIYSFMPSDCIWDNSNYVVIITTINNDFLTNFSNLPLLLRSTVSPKHVGKLQASALLALGPYNSHKCMCNRGAGPFTTIRCALLQLVRSLGPVCSLLGQLMVTHRRGNTKIRIKLAKIKSVDNATCGQMLDKTGKLSKEY